MTGRSLNSALRWLLVGLILPAFDCLRAAEQTLAPTRPTPSTPLEASQGLEVADPTALDPGILASVQDPERGIKTLGIREQEREAYYYVLHRARTGDYRLLKAAARKLQEQRRQRYRDPRVRDDPEVPFPVFVDLFKSADNPDVYHGKPVTLTGHIRLLREVPAGENSYGIATLYEAWLYTEDSQNNPACIVCTMLPDGMLQAFDASRSHVLDQVSVTGYFFKMMGYPAEDVYRYAPLILAQRLEWRRIEQPKPNPWLSKYGIPIALAVALGVILLVRFLTRPGRAFRERRLHAEQPETSFDSLFDDGK